MTRLSSGEKTESMIGDLMEQYQHGRSSFWYWRQAIIAIVFWFGAEMWRNSVVSIWVIAVGAYLPEACWMLVWPTWLVRLDAWYPLLIRSKLSWMATNPWAYRLQPYSLTSRVLFCALLAMTAWTLTRLHRRHRGLVVTLLLFTQVGLSAPYLLRSVANWLHEPANPIWFFQCLWFSISVFVERPVSIVYGAYRLAKPFALEIRCDLVGDRVVSDPAPCEFSCHKDGLRRQWRGSVASKNLRLCIWRKDSGSAGQRSRNFARHCRGQRLGPGSVFLDQAGGSADAHRTLTAPLS